MKLSIIIPTYNSEQFLETTLLSIKEQTYQNFEILIADGGSTDNTRKIAKSFPFVKIVSFNDLGQSDGINKAYGFATGDIIAWQNSDDVYMPNCFEIVTNFFLNNENIDAVYGDYNLIDSNGSLIRQCHSYLWSQHLFKIGRFVPLQPTFFWRKTVSDKIFPLNNDLKFCMDVDFVAKSDLAGYKLKYIPFHLGDFRMHNLSKTTDIKNTLSVISEHSKVLIGHYKYNFREKFLLYYYLTRLLMIKLVLNFLA